VYHEQVFSTETGEQLEDKIFHVFYCFDVKGDLIEQFEGGKNAWKTLSEAILEPQVFESMQFEADIAVGKLSFIERNVRYQKNQF
jgi:hypothetical protein